MNFCNRYICMDKQKAREYVIVLNEVVNKRYNSITPKRMKDVFAVDKLSQYYFTDDKKLIYNKIVKRYFVDCLLTYKYTNLAIVEAKSEDKDPLDRLEQSINYAQKFKIDYAYSTNGKKII